MKEQINLPAPVNSMASAAINESKKDHLEGVFDRVSTVLPVQRSLSIGAVDDPLEKQADNMADKVMGMPEHAFVQKKYADCDEEKVSRKENIPSFFNIQKNAISSKSSEIGVLQKKENTSAASDQVISGIKNSTGKGDSLPQDTLSEMNNSFGMDFSKVKIHKDSEAATMSRQLDAKAFTSGQDIYFNDGQFNTSSREGKKLLVHELTHVVQQGFGAGENKIQRQLDETATTTESIDNASKTAYHAQTTQGGKLPSWSEDFITISLKSAKVKCKGFISRDTLELMSECKIPHFCTVPVWFNFHLYFHMDEDLIPRPTPFKDAQISLNYSFLPDGQTSPTYNKSYSETAKYISPGDPLKTSFGKQLSFQTSTSGSFTINATMTDPTSGITLNYNDVIRCEITPCI